MSRTLIVGYGYLGRRVADLAISAGDQVWATTRNPQKIQQMGSGPIAPIRMDWNDRRTLANLPSVDRVLVSVAYDRASAGVGSRFDSQVGGLAALLSAIGPQVDVCYISTTGVYHQSDGRWVDENSPTFPTREGGQVHLAAENQLHRLRPHSPWTVLRLAGIYGPGRVPRAADVIAGRPIASPGDGYLNLIHVDDGAAAVMASWTGPSARLYVVADDEPMRRTDFYTEIARQCRVPAPRFVDPAPDAPVRMRSDSNKRVSNGRLRRELLPRLLYPTYREGLADVLGSDRPGNAASQQ